MEEADFPDSRCLNTLPAEGTGEEKDVHKPPNERFPAYREKKDTGCHFKKHAEFSNSGAYITVPNERSCGDVTPVRGSDKTQTVKNKDSMYFILSLLDLFVFFSEFLNKKIHFF